MPVDSCVVENVLSLPLDGTPPEENHEYDVTVPMTDGSQEIVSSVVALVGLQRRDATVGFGSVAAANSPTSIGCDALLQAPS